MLPNMKHPDGISKWRTVDFGGINHRLGAGNGDIWDDQNLTSDEYPVLKTRPGEHRIESSFYGKYGAARLIPGYAQYLYIGQNGISYSGMEYLVGSFSEMQSITLFNHYAIIMPKKTWVRTDVVRFVDSLPAQAPDGVVVCLVTNQPSTTWKVYVGDGSAWQDAGYVQGDIEAKVTGSFTIIDGTYAGSPAEANTIKASSGDFRNYFSPGDGLTLSGTAFPTERTLVVREVTATELRFYEHSFDDEKTSVAKSMTIARKMPDLDWLFVNENRVWGCNKWTVYASKLGDFKNWNVFDGLSTDSYAVEVPEDGLFTGGVSYVGYPTFFKRDALYKVYGNKPSNFEIKRSTQTGCVNGKTVVVVNDTLYYLSANGVMRYDGGYSSNVSAALGNLIADWGTFQSVSASANKNKYVLFREGTKEFFEYDPQLNIWHKQKITEFTGNISYAWRDDDGMWLISTENEAWEPYPGLTPEAIQYFVEFADFTEDVSKAPAYGANFKGLGKLQLRMALGANSTATVEIKFDEGDWETVQQFTTQIDKRSFYLPITPRRCDHFRLRISGTGDFTLWSLARESYKGSALKGGSL